MKFLIALLTAATGILHLVVGFGLVGGGGTNWMLVLNGVGYLVLLVLFWMASGNGGIIRWILLAYTLITFIGYFALNAGSNFGFGNTFALVIKAIELLLLILLFLYRGAERAVYTPATTAPTRGQTGFDTMATRQANMDATVATMASTASAGMTSAAAASAAASASMLDRAAATGDLVVDEPVDTTSDLANAAGDAVDWVGDKAGDAVDAVVDAAEATVDAAGDAVDWVGDKAKDAYDATADIAGDAVDAVGDAAGATADAAGDAVGWVGDKAGDAVDAVGDAAGATADAAGDAVDWVGDKAGDAVDAVGDAAGATADAAGDAVGWVGDKAGDAVDAVGDAAGATADAAGDAVGWVGDKVEDAYDATVDVAKDAAGAVGDGVDATGDALRGGAAAVAGTTAYAADKAAGTMAAGAAGLDAEHLADEPSADELRRELEQYLKSFGSSEFTKNVEYVEGIGALYGQKLRDMGIHNVTDLVVNGATRRGRKHISDLTGIAQSLILTWVNHVDLFRIKGVAQEYADLLEQSGVDTVVELAQRNPANLYKRMLEVNEQKSLVRRAPHASEVQSWVEQAKSLRRLIYY